MTAKAAAYLRVIKRRRKLRNFRTAAILGLICSAFVALVIYGINVVRFH
jgi:hypothetical protein